MIGKTLGHYKILKQLGQGGMGEVYLADDTTLDRKVALKFLPEAFTSDPERMARFEREAKLLASLNHPNIAGIYGLEQADGSRFLVLEYVEGETLQARLSKGALPLEDAITLCRQIAEGLEAAHEKGVIHRDLKPANVMITAEEKVKILDFGLAKALADETGSIDSSQSPTLTEAMTQPGVILGTAAYMSPEQAKGKSVDKRADIWAFGCILFECLTGKKAFEGETVTEMLAAVLKSTPDLQALPATTPPNIRFLLRRCLEKDMSRRFRDAADVCIEIEEARGIGEAKAPVKILWLAWGVAAIFAVALILSLLLWSPWHAIQSSEQPLVRLDVDLGPEVSLGSLAGSDVIISPDGNRLVFVSNSRLFTRRLDQPKATELDGTEGAYAPFFSPNGQWIAFFTSSKLKKISVEGGAVTTLCDTYFSPGGSWGENGDIIVALTRGGSLVRISPAGVVGTNVTTLAQGEVTHRWPQILPGGKAVLFTSHTMASGFDSANIEIISLKDHRRKTLWRGGTYGRYLPSGHIVYINKGTLYAMPFDLDKLEVLGSPYSVLEEVAVSTDGSAQFDFSHGGTLVYRSGKAAGGLVTLQWLDGDGKTQPLTAEVNQFTQPRLSPDGKLLALTVASESGSDLRIYDWQRDAITRLTFGGGIFNYPVWSLDGHYVVFSDAKDILWTRADGSGKPQILTQSKNQPYPWSFSPDGKRLAFSEYIPGSGSNIWTVPIENEGGQLRAEKPEIFLKSSSFLANPVFSPDGRWIAYLSWESGIGEIEVRAFPDKGGKWVISNSDAVFAVWSQNGRDLFYRTEDQRIMVVTYTVKGDSFVADKACLWTDKRLADTSYFQNLDITRDGKRFVVLLPAQTPDEQKAHNHVIFMQNFFDDLHRRIPIGTK